MPGLNPEDYDLLPLDPTRYELKILTPVAVGGSLKIKAGLLSNSGPLEGVEHEVPLSNDAGFFLCEKSEWKPEVGAVFFTFSEEVAREELLRNLHGLEHVRFRALGTPSVAGRREKLFFKSRQTKQSEIRLPHFRLRFPLFSMVPPAIGLQLRSTRSNQPGGAEGDGRLRCCSTETSVAITIRRTLSESVDSSIPSISRNGMHTRNRERLAKHDESL